MNIHNINVIARYEIKLLRRSWLFRIFALLTLTCIFGILLINHTAVVNRYGYIWPRVALTSLIPFTAVYYYNIAQSVIVIFLAGSFLKRDKKLDTAEVIYVRPMSNSDYLIGKTWGIMKVFLLLHITVFVMAGFINLLIAQSPFSPFPYLFYLLTLSVPSLLFVLGLSFTLMCLLKNQAVTFLIMLGIIGTVFFYLSDSCFGLFDFFGVSIPTIFSDVTGHADLRSFLLQRSAYFLAGTGLIGLTVTLVKRLPQRPWKTAVIRALSLGMLLLACLPGGWYVLHYRHQLSLRARYADTFNAYAGRPKVRITQNDLTLTRSANRIEASSTLTVSNPHDTPLQEILLYLNPALQLSGITGDTGQPAFERDNQVIRIHLPLAPQAEQRLTLHYAGRIDENICYTDIPEKELLNPKPESRIYRTGKRYAWTEERFTLLTPECLWYPVAQAPAHPAAPYAIQKDFTRFTLTVNNTGDQTVLSQGESVREGDCTVFTPSRPLAALSLTIADYEKKSLQVDSVSYEIYNFKGHDYYSGFFTRLQDTLPSLIRELKNQTEVSKNRNYPFSRFILAEVPAPFADHIRNWKGYTESVMPEIVCIAERGFRFNFDIAASQRQHQEWRRDNTSAPDPLETEIMTFNSLCGNFLKENLSAQWNWRNPAVNPYNIAPMFFNHNSYVHSETYPVMDIILNTMQQAAPDSGPFWNRIINDRQRANLYLENHSLRDAISDRGLKPEILYELIKLKSEALKNYITARIPAQTFDDFLKDFFTRHSSRNIEFDTFTEAVRERFGLTLCDFIQEWYTVDHSPTLYIRHVDANQMVTDEQTRYQTKFQINNPSDLDAVITVAIEESDARMSSGRRSRYRDISSTPDPGLNYRIPAGRACEIRTVTDNRPVSVRINTNISHNLPTEHIFNFPKIETVTQDTASGVFPLDPALFRPNPNEIIVDNEDPGFRTISPNARHKLKDLLRRKEDEKYQNFTPWFMPPQWTAVAADYCYGETVQSAVYKKKGNGSHAAEWKAEIPQDGYYELSVWNPLSDIFSSRRRNRHQEERNQTYTVRYGQEKESITLNLEAEQEGWLSLGSFYLPRGTATVTLTDKVSGRYAIADAVKFTRIEP